MATMKRMLAKVWPTTNTTASSPEPAPPSDDSNEPQYNFKVDNIRDSEYPTLVGTTYLDHAGTTPYAKSLIESWTAELTTNLFGNPHSASAASQLSTRRIDDIRLRTLKFFNANPDDFDVVFVANATAAIKLVAEAFRDNDDGFWFGYHADAHTSLVGCRELADRGSTCFANDHSFETWISSIKPQNGPSDVLQLVAYPGQSNMTGRRLSMNYCQQIRQNAKSANSRIFTLLDVASLVSTSPLDLSDSSKAPDFTALSFYKVFGFPDLGALVVRKASASPLMSKRYFAGGTVDGVATSGTNWHVKKPSVHSALEEGTLSFHNIIALDHAMDIQQRLFESMEAISKHTRYLAREAKQFLEGVRHANQSHVCEIYGECKAADNGPIVAFNLKDSSGNIISASEVEKLCIVKGIQLRTGGVCNPGGIAHHLNLSKEQIMSNYHAGRRCGGDSEVINGQPTGVIRISFGAMSTTGDLHNFINFIQEYYVERDVLQIPQSQHAKSAESSFRVTSLSVYPIKSCGAFTIPRNQRWKVTPKGLAWDREWCLVHEGTNVALSQKRYPTMALLRPTIDLFMRKLIVSCEANETDVIEIDLDEEPVATKSLHTCQMNKFKLQNSKVCGDTIPIQVYKSTTINDFFSRILGVPCCLARYPRNTMHTRNVSIRKPSNDVSGQTTSNQTHSQPQPQLMLSNESPILIVSSSSVDELNKQIRLNKRQQHNDKTKSKTTTVVSPSIFRANIVVSQQDDTLAKSPYIEDTWTSLTIVPANTSAIPTAKSSASYPNTTLNRTLDHSRASSDNQSDLSVTTNSRRSSMPGSFSTNTDIDIDTDITASNNIDIEAPPSALHLNILGPCQRCQMLSINQRTAVTQQEPFSTLVKTRRKGDGRVWFGVHAALVGDDHRETVDVGIGDLVVTG